MVLERENYLGDSSGHISSKNTHPPQSYNDVNPAFSQTSTLQNLETNIKAGERWRENGIVNNGRNPILELARGLS
jgi:hypothetical protein